MPQTPLGLPSIEPCMIILGEPTIQYAWALPHIFRSWKHDSPKLFGSFLIVEEPTEIVSFNFLQIGQSQHL